MSIEEQISQLIEQYKYETNEAQYEAKVKPYFLCTYNCSYGVLLGIGKADGEFT